MQALDILCIVMALAIGILGILFLFNVLQNYWFLNFILGLGVLLHAALLLLFLVKHRQVYAGISVLLILVYAGSLIYFNFL